MEETKDATKKASPMNDRATCATSQPERSAGMGARIVFGARGELATARRASAVTVAPNCTTAI